eukprot:scaffold113588_cov18-Prasinocladus_malaysianus.AAC.1
MCFRERAYCETHKRSIHDRVVTGHRATKKSGGGRQSLDRRDHFALSPQSPSLTTLGIEYGRPKSWTHVRVKNDNRTPTTWFKDIIRAMKSEDFLYERM